MIQRSSAQGRASATLRVFLLVLLVTARADAQTTLFNGVEVPGVVIAHSPASSRLYVGSPSLVILPNGDYVASRDVFGPRSGGSTSGTTLLFKSTDRGQTWSPLATLNGQVWSGLFVHNGDLYMMGPNRTHGDMVICRSTDGGATWTTPTNASSGLLRPTSGGVGASTSGVPVVVANGRVWRAYEDNGGPSGWPRQYRAGMMSAPVDSNLLDAGNWVSTNMLTRSASWLPDGSFKGWLEGNAVATRDGGVVNVLRVDVNTGKSEFAAIVRAQNPSTLTFDHHNDIVPMPGGSKKFTIRYHAETDVYWMLANIVTADNQDATVRPAIIRNIVALVRRSSFTTVSS